MSNCFTRFICRFLAATVAGALLFGCRSGSDSASEIPVFVTTTDVFRALIEPVVGARGRVERLLPAGASPHTYEPRPSDLRRTSNAAALFYGSPQLDGWAVRLGNGHTMALMDLVPDSLYLEFGRAHVQETSVDHHEGIDPHFWMDPVAVRSILPALADSLCTYDRDGCEAYGQNARAFGARLGALDDSLRVALAPVGGSAVLLSHPFLGYFARRYGLEVAGIIEEIPGSEPTPRDMLRLVEEVERSRALAIFTQPQLPTRAAEAVAEVVGLPVVELNPLSIGEPGTFSYEELLYYNAEKIVRALTVN